ncbi:sensor histidine kinase [Nonomuraea sp. bgisy101]|uniref:sensor histidine kinase n=1 Tax=Nonomuraea sp. bgisy101 TaxID=3413784 RepID=UPI003D70F583
MTDISTDYERLRRATMWTVAGGVALPWLGMLGAATDPTQPAVWRAVAAVIVLVVFSFFYVRGARAMVQGAYARREVIVTGVLGVVFFVLLREQFVAAAMAPVTWVALAVLHVPRRRAVLIGVGAVAVSAAIMPGGTFFYALMIGLVGFLSRFQFWFWTVVKAAHDGRDAKAKLAVTEERLRFSRDMHDIVGHSLSAIAVKSELAARLASGEAAKEMMEVRRLARESLKEIRAVVRGYRTVDLHAELHSVRAVMEAAGISCALELPDGGLSEEVSTLLAWLVRESSTNVLRHSAATHCRIKVVTGADAVELTVSNDHPKRPRGTAGTGLAGMSERVTALGGVLTAGQSDGQFVVRARIPT